MELPNESAPLSTQESDDKKPQRLVASPWTWLLLILSLGVVMPFVPVPSLAASVVGAIVLTVVYTVSIVLFAALVTREVSSWQRRAAIFAGALLLWCAMQFIVAPTVLDLFMALRSEGARPTTAHNILRYSVLTVTDAALLCAAIFGGSLLSRLITEASMLGPICALAALIDIWGVLLGGIVSQVIEKAPDIAAKGMASMPTAGAATTSKFVIPLPDIGAGDYLFFGLLFAALHAHNMNWRGTVKLMTPLIIIALLAIPLSDILAARRLIPQPIMLPGLLFIGLGAALPNLRFFKYSRDEKFALLYAAILVVFLTAGLYFGVTNLLPRK